MEAAFFCDEDGIESDYLTPLPETGANIIRQPCFDLLEILGSASPRI